MKGYQIMVYYTPTPHPPQAGFEKNVSNEQWKKQKVPPMLVLVSAIQMGQTPVMWRKNQHVVKIY